MKKTQLLVILGPTATGKSDLAIDLALMIARDHIGGYDGAEIISADSRQVYRGMDIGTGKITTGEMHGVPHHLLDVVGPRKVFTVMDFKEMAEKAITDIRSRNRLPIICGGTGFYIDTLINEIEFPNVGADMELRKKLRDKTADQLYAMLLKLDPIRAGAMNESDRSNPHRLIRGIEIRTAQTRSIRVTKMESRHKYDPLFIGLKVPVEELRERIHKRLLNRLGAGMIEEARKLHMPISGGGSGLSWKRMQELGLEYRYEALYLQGKITESEMIERLTIAIGRYAKRQMTWFKRNTHIKWFKPNEKTMIEKSVIEKLTTNH